jgi:hypothetical protein
VRARELTIMDGEAYLPVIGLEADGTVKGLPTPLCRA